MSIEQVFLSSRRVCAHSVASYDIHRRVLHRVWWLSPGDFDAREVFLSREEKKSRRNVRNVKNLHLTVLLDGKLVSTLLSSCTHGIHSRELELDMIEMFWVNVTQKIANTRTFIAKKKTETILCSMRFGLLTARWPKRVIRKRFVVASIRVNGVATLSHGSGSAPQHLTHKNQIRSILIGQIS